MYDEVQYKRQGNDGIDLVEKVPLSEGAGVLDLGCGTGFLASIIAKRIGEKGSVTAVDPDKDRLKVAIKKYSMQKNIVFLETNSENFPNGPYDTVFSNHVLHSIKDKSSVFQRVYDQLKVGGHFAFLCCLTLPSSVWEIVTPTEDQTDYLCSKEVYESLASKYGFFVEYSSVDEIVYTFDNVQQYIDFVLASVHVTSGETNSSTLRMLKERFGNGNVSVEWDRVMYVLKKTHNAKVTDY